MKTFASLEAIPLSFKGECYLKGAKCTLYVLENRVYHRIGGPALIMENGIHYYYQSNSQHRLDGPAHDHKFAEDYNAAVYDKYYINDKRYTPEEFWAHPLVIANLVKRISEL